MESDFPGGLAQLGERLAGSQKVTGSSPVSSTEDLFNRDLAIKVHTKQQPTKKPTFS